MQEFNTDAVLISGMGPAGLGAACEAIISGKKVVIVTNRPENEQIRPQRVTLTQNSIRYLQNLLVRMGVSPLHLSPEDQVFINQLDYGNTFAIKNIEKFLLRRIQEYRKRDYPVEIIDNTEITQISILGTAKIGDNRTVNFKHLICADGVGRHAVKMCNDHLPESQKITFKSDAEQPHPWHVSAYVTITTADQSPLNIPEEIYVGTEQGYHYGLAFKPGISNNSIKCNVTAELPVELSSGSNENILAYLQALVNKAFGCQTVIKVKEGKSSKTTFSKFKMHLEQANSALINYGNVSVILAGDSYRSPNYQLGHGLNNALIQAEMLGKFFRGEIGESEYNKVCELCGVSAEEETRQNQTQPEQFVEQLSASAKLLSFKTKGSQFVIEKLRKYFYSCMPEVEERDISLFSMLNYFDEQGRTFLHMAIDNKVMELSLTVGPIQLFLGLNYFFEPMSQGDVRYSLLDYAVLRKDVVFIFAIIDEMKGNNFFEKLTALLERGFSSDMEAFKIVIIALLGTIQDSSLLGLAEKFATLLMEKPDFFAVIEDIHNRADLKKHKISWGDIFMWGSEELKAALNKGMDTENEISLFDILCQVRDHVLFLNSFRKAYAKFGLLPSVDAASSEKTAYGDSASPRLE